jgi:hypothetical protein
LKFLQLEKLDIKIELLIGYLRDKTLYSKEMISIEEKVRD